MTGATARTPTASNCTTQYQVILKPDPGNPQELYLESLKALGIDPRQHDIRFVEDNWEQPAISAWGLGWEVWLDGQEITQFTYFQQMGGVTLDPVSVELTYGLERILIALNNAKAIWDEEWAEDVLYGETPPAGGVRTLQILLRSGRRGTRPRDVRALLRRGGCLPRAGTGPPRA